MSKKEDLCQFPLFVLRAKDRGSFRNSHGSWGGGEVGEGSPRSAIQDAQSLGLLQRGQIYLAKKEDKKDEEKPEEKPKDPPKAADPKPKAAEPANAGGCSNPEITKKAIKAGVKATIKTAILTGNPEAALIDGWFTAGKVATVESTKHYLKEKAEEILVQYKTPPVRLPASDPLFQQQVLKPGDPDYDKWKKAQPAGKASSPSSPSSSSPSSGSWGATVKELTGKSIGQLSEDELGELRHNSSLLTPTEAELLTKAYFDRKSEGK